VGDGGNDWTVCRCKMHERSQAGVPVGEGCWKDAIGKHPAVRAAEIGEHGYCNVFPATRVADGRFYEVCKSVKKGILAFESDVNDYRWVQRKFATGASELKDFGRGYCHFLGLRKGFYNRVARVFGPNMYTWDYLKVLCVAGKAQLPPMVVIQISPGLIHMEERANGEITDGTHLYYTLAKYTLKYPNSRIGVFDGLQNRAFSSAVTDIQFGSMPKVTAEESWSERLELDIVSLVTTHLGSSAAAKLVKRISYKEQIEVSNDVEELIVDPTILSKPEDDGDITSGFGENKKFKVDVTAVDKAARNALNRHNKKLAKRLRKQQGETLNSWNKCITEDLIHFDENVQGDETTVKLHNPMHEGFTWDELLEDEWKGFEELSNEKGQ